MTEQTIQAKIKKKLTAAGWLVRKVIQCSDAGWPDLEAFKLPGRCVHIECKRPGEKPTDVQEYRHAQLRACGFEVVVASSVEDVQHLLYFFWPLLLRFVHP